MWWYVFGYLAVSAFVYGFVKHSRDPYHTTDDEVLAISLFWPIIIPTLLFGCVFVVAFGLLILVLFPFQLLGFLAYSLFSALFYNVRSKKS